MTDPGSEAAAVDVADIVELIRGGERFVVTGHLRPDADALGSAIALAGLLRAEGKTAILYCMDGVPEKLTFLLGDEVAETDLSNESFDAAFVMDAAAVKMVPSLPAGVPIVVVDHHASHERFGDVIWRDASACATGELVWRLAEALGQHERLSPTVANAIYAALSADTGGFRYPSCTATVHRIVAQLMDMGVSSWELSRALFESWERARLRLLGLTLEKFQAFDDDGFCLVALSYDEVAGVGGRPDMVDGLVDYPRRLQGVEVAGMLYEYEPGSVRLSLRANGDVNVAAIAEQFGGGGHKAAAGASFKSDLSDARDRLVAEVRRVLQKHD